MGGVHRPSPRAEPVRHGRRRGDQNDVTAFLKVGILSQDGTQPRSLPAALPLSMRVHRRPWRCCRPRASARIAERRHNGRVAGAEALSQIAVTMNIYAQVASEGTETALTRLGEQFL